MKYEAVIGLETHVELSTQTKIFCGCTTKFGGEPNSHCCHICLGFPGTLPTFNRAVVNYAIKAGLATNCRIANYTKMDRKNYVYPDLPKAYQISQYDHPICVGGHIELSNGRKVGITRIHMEEDAGKLVHQKGDIYVDYNRGAVPLVEIVTEPDLRSAEEVREYLERLQLIMRYLGVSDCKMQEGSMRCDVNISVRKAGEEKLGVRAEIKNMNSLTFIEKAIRYEVERHIDALENGLPLYQETRRYNEETDATESMRDKEDAQDYRYFRDPDLVTMSITDELIESIRKEIPELPEQKLHRYIEQFGLQEKDAAMLVRYRKIAEYFEKAIDGVANPKTVANFITGQIFRMLPNEQEKEDANIKLIPENLKELVLLLENNKISMQQAKSALDQMLETGKKVSDVLSEEDMEGMDENALKQICAQVIQENSNAVNDYRNGKEKALKSLIGGVMKHTKGKADPVQSENMIKELLK